MKINGVRCELGFQCRPAQPRRCLSLVLTSMCPQGHMHRPKSGSVWFACSIESHRHQAFGDECLIPCRLIDDRLLDRQPDFMLSSESLAPFHSAAEETTSLDNEVGSARSPCFLQYKCSTSHRSIFVGWTDYLSIASPGFYP